MFHLVMNASLTLFGSLTVFNLFWELLLVVKTGALEILKIVPIPISVKVVYPLYYGIDFGVTINCATFHSREK